MGPVGNGQGRIRQAALRNARTFFCPRPFLTELLCFLPGRARLVPRDRWLSAGKLASRPSWSARVRHTRGEAVPEENGRRRETGASGASCPQSAGPPPLPLPSFLSLSSLFFLLARCQRVSSPILYPNSLPTKPLFCCCFEFNLALLCSFICFFLYGFVVCASLGSHH